jgi:fatty acid desaturase
MSMEAPAASAMKEFSGRSDANGWRQLAIHGGLLFGAGLLVAIAPGWWVLPAMLLLGIVQVALFAPFHETSHYTAFASHRINTIVGWVVGLPSLYNWHFYQRYHHAHHRHTQDPARDPELGDPPTHTWPDYLRRMFALAFWQFRLQILRDGLRSDLSAYPYIAPASAPLVIRSIRAEVATLLGGTLLSMLLFGWQTPFLFWILPQLIAQPLLRMYLFTEHTGCTTDRNGLTNTRTVLTSKALRVLMWNMPFHAEHHLYPFIPFHRLEDAHAVLRDKLGQLQPGYARWHLDYMKGLKA